MTRRSALEAAYEHFRLNLLGNRVSDNTVRHYDYMVRPFLAWAAEGGLRRFEDVPVEWVRHYRAEVDDAGGPPVGGPQRAPRIRR